MKNILKRKPGYLYCPMGLCLYNASSSLFRMPLRGI